MYVKSLHTEISKLITSTAHTRSIPKFSIVAQSTFPKALVMKLAFKGTAASGLFSDRKPRLALILGRPIATHHTLSDFHSNWIVALDQTQLLWALYTKDKVGRANVEVNTDAAFGADRSFR